MTNNAETLETFGQRIRSIREARGLSLARTSKMSGGTLTPNGLYRIEYDASIHGRTNPKATTLIGLCRALNIRIVIDGEGMWVEE